MKSTEIGFEPKISGKVGEKLKLPMRLCSTDDETLLLLTTYKMVHNQQNYAKELGIRSMRYYIGKKKLNSIQIVICLDEEFMLKGKWYQLLFWFMSSLPLFSAASFASLGLPEASTYTPFLPT